MSTRKTANDVSSDLKIHEAQCAERWRSMFKKTDDLQGSVQSMKTWLLAGLTTIIISLMAIIIRGIV